MAVKSLRWVDQCLLEHATTEDRREFFEWNHVLVLERRADLAFDGDSRFIAIQSDALLDKVGQDRLHRQLVDKDIIFTLIMHLDMLHPHIVNCVRMLLHSKEALLRSRPASTCDTDIVACLRHHGSPLVLRRLGLHLHLWQFLAFSHPLLLNRLNHMILCIDLISLCCLELLILWFIPELRGNGSFARLLWLCSHWLLLKRCTFSIEWGRD